LPLQRLSPDGGVVVPLLPTLPLLRHGLLLQLRRVHFTEDPTGDFESGEIDENYFHVVAGDPPGARDAHPHDGARPQGPRHHRHVAQRQLPAQCAHQLDTLHPNGLGAAVVDGELKNTNKTFYLAHNLIHFSSV